MLRACIRPIAKMEAEARDKYRDEMIQYKNDVARAKSTKTEEPQHPRLARHMIENVSIEAISEVLRSDGEGTMYAPASKVLAYQDEMGEFFANMDKYRAGGKGGDRGTYLRLYNGGAHSIDRIIRGSIWCKDWSAGFLGGIQPAPIQRIAKYCDDDGLLQRFMYCVPSGRYPECDRRPDTIAIARYHSIVVGLARLPPPQEVVQLDEGAHAHREAVNELLRMEGRNAEKRLKSTLEKWRGLFARLCLTFHLIEEMENRPMGKLVSEATARRVRKFIEHIALPHLMRADAVMFSTEQTEHAKWIAGHILSKNLTRIQMRDVAMAYRALRPPECKQERESVMASLVAAGWLESEEPKYRATGICAWMVNPRVHEAF
jgi:hypothetical protein